MFSITKFCKGVGKGFKITFDNGVTFSCQFGFMNYCNNKYGKDGDDSKDAEIAAWGEDHTFIKLDGENDVIGNCSPAEVLAFMNQAAAITF